MLKRPLPSSPIELVHLWTIKKDDTAGQTSTGARTKVKSLQCWRQAHVARVMMLHELSYVGKMPQHSLSAVATGVGFLQHPLTHNCDDYIILLDPMCINHSTLPQQTILQG